MTKDYYGILGVNKSASEAELKSAYRKKAMEFHPDRNPNNTTAEKNFKDVNEAYEVLKDPQKRSMYDQGMYNPQGGGFGGGGFSNADFGDIGSMFGDIFGDIFGDNNNRRRRPPKGKDLVYSLTISLEEAYKGVEKDISFKTLVSCPTCKSKGYEGSPKYSTCNVCKGKGKLQRKMGFFHIEQPCNSCSGEGKTLSNPCSTCAGHGRVNKEKTVSIEIPKGIENDMKIRLAGKGESGFKGSVNGDLYVIIKISPHKHFTRKHNNLYLRVAIPLSLAITGGKINIITLDGKEIDVDIPKGINSGQKIRLFQKGIRSIHSNVYGDLYIETIVETPKNLSKEEIEIVKKLFPITAQNKVKILEK